MPWTGENEGEQSRQRKAMGSSACKMHLSGDGRILIELRAKKECRASAMDRRKKSKLK
jgi:hypothetical protein